MKKILILALTAFFGMQAHAQTLKQKVNVSEVKAVATTKAENYAEITFDTLRYDFGKFSKDDPVVRCQFPFTNTGTAPLVIHQAFASCGCTIPVFTREPVKPGTVVMAEREAAANKSAATKGIWRLLIIFMLLFLIC